MKVVSLLGGLGSQMQKYALFLKIKESTEDNCFIDTSYYHQNQSWNGFELKRVFGVNAPDFIDVLDNDSLNRILNNEENYISVVLKYLVRDRTTFYYFLGIRSEYRNYNFLTNFVRVIMHKCTMTLYILGIKFKLSCDSKSKKNMYIDETYMNSDYLFKDIKQQIVDTFQFPKLDEYNQNIAEQMLSTASVSIHVRRTDHLADNKRLYKKHYYIKAIDFIKKRENSKLYFYVFSDDVNWCKTHLCEIGLNSNDNVNFVDWNHGNDSYKDMQLMTYCKHNVLAISSFSWWGAYLSIRDDKLVCAPERYWDNVEYHF